MLVQAAKILRTGGATNIYVVATHGLFAGDACKIIMESCIDEVSPVPYPDFFWEYRFL